MYGPIWLVRRGHCSVFWHFGGLTWGNVCDIVCINWTLNKKVKFLSILKASTYFYGKAFSCHLYVIFSIFFFRFDERKILLFVGIGFQLLGRIFLFPIPGNPTAPLKNSTSPNLYHSINDQNLKTNPLMFYEEPRSLYEYQSFSSKLASAEAFPSFLKRLRFF